LIKAPFNGAFIVFNFLHTRQLAYSGNSTEEHRKTRSVVDNDENIPQRIIAVD
jgi:hypothetical protein